MISEFKKNVAKLTVRPLQPRAIGVESRTSAGQIDAFAEDLVVGLERARREHPEQRIEHDERDARIRSA